MKRDVSRGGRDHRRLGVPVPAGVAPLDLTLAILHELVAEHRAVVTEVDVVAPDQATVTLRIPGHRPDSAAWIDGKEGPS